MLGEDGDACRSDQAQPSLLDADGAALVIHAAADDYVTDPSGNSGARIACGVIQPVAEIRYTAADLWQPILASLANDDLRVHSHGRVHEMRAMRLVGAGLRDQGDRLGFRAGSSSTSPFGAAPETMRAPAKKSGAVKSWPLPD